MIDKVQVQEKAKKIMEEFASSLKVVENVEFILPSEPFESLRMPTNGPFKELKEGMLRNFPKKKGGEPLMEKKEW